MTNVSQDHSSLNIWIRASMFNLAERVGFPILPLARNDGKVFVTLMGGRDSWSRFCANCYTPDQFRLVWKELRKLELGVAA